MAASSGFVAATGGAAAAAGRSVIAAAGGAAMVAVAAPGRAVMAGSGGAAATGRPVGAVLRAGSGPGPGQRPRHPGASGDARLAVRRFVHLCVEVLNGFRPAGHLRGLSLPSQAAEVVAAGLAGSRWVAELRKAKKTRRPAPVAVLKVHLCEPRPGVVEVAVVLVTGERTWAMALRMELHEQAWVATTLRLI